MERRSEVKSTRVYYEKYMHGRRYIHNIHALWYPTTPSHHSAPLHHSPPIQVDMDKVVTIKQS